MTDNFHETSQNYSLTAKQSRAVGYLLTCRTVADAAQKTGVTERTIFSWMKLDNFRAALHDAGRDSIDQTSRRLAQGQTDALETLAALITKGRNEGVKRAAAVDWLNLTLKYRDITDIESRLTALEAAINDKK